MELSLELILEQIKIKLPRIYMREENSRQRFSGYAVFSRSVPAENENLLHIGLLTDLLAMPHEKIKGLTFCCVGSNNDMAQAMQTHKCCVLHFNYPADLASCCNEIQRVFNELERLNIAMDQVLNKKEEVQELINLIAHYLEEPIFVWDNSFRVVAKNTQIDVAHHPILKYIMEEDRLPTDVLVQVARRGGIMHNNNIYNMLQISYPPNITNLTFALRVFLASQKSVLAMCCYFLNASVTQGRIELLKLLAEKIDAYVKSNYPRLQFKTKIYEHFIVDLIEGRLFQKEQILEKLHLINMPYQAEYRIYFIKPRECTASIINYLFHSGKQTLPYSKIIHYHDGVLIIDQVSKENRDSDVVINKIIKSRRNISQISAKCGVSSLCYDLSQIRNAFLQAKASLRLGQRIDPDEVVYFYRDYYIYHILEICENHPDIDLSCLYFKRLDNLEANDQEHSSNNMELLETYLRNNRNITNTAREMHLHRNSIIYRIERIEEILRVSLCDPDVQFRLLFSFRVRRMIATSQPPNISEEAV